MGFMIVLMFTMPQPIFTVTGLRFWTAGWLAILCTLKIFLSNNYKYFLILLLTPFIHVVFWVYVFLLVVTFFVVSVEKVSEKILYIVYFLSYPFSYLSMSFALDFVNVDLLPSSLQLMLLTYTSEEQIEEFNDKHGTGWFWVSELFEIALNIYYLLLSCFLILHRNLILKKEDKRLFLFTLVVYSFANFTSIVPHLGLRFVGFAKILLPLLWFRIFGLNRYKLIIYLYPICAFFYIFRIRLMEHYAKVLDVDFLYDSFIVMVIKQLICIN